MRTVPICWIQLDEFGDNYTSVVLSGAENGPETREEGKFAQFSECQEKELNLCQ